MPATPKTRRKELTPYERARISGAHACGVPLRKISRDLDIPLSTVRSTVIQEPTRSEGKSLPRPGRPSTGRSRRKSRRSDMETEADFRPALLIVDFQEDFCPPHGSLAVDGGREIVHVINHLLDLPFSRKLATKDWHPPTHVSFASNHLPPDNKPFESFALVRNPENPAETYHTRLWPVHCVQGTPGAELVPELEVRKVDQVIEKGQDDRVEMYSAFADPFENPSIATSGLSGILKEAGVTHVYVVGLAMDYCVKCTAMDAAKEGFVTYVVQEGTKAVDPGEKGWGAAQKDLNGAGVAMVTLTGPELTRVNKLR